MQRFWQALSIKVMILKQNKIKGKTMWLKFKYANLFLLLYEEKRL